MASRLTQEVVEVLSTTTPAARLTQEVVEVLATATSAARLTQEVVEVLSAPAPDAQLSQVVAEVLRTGTAVPAHLSQVVLEILRTGTAVDAQLSQAVLEVLRVNGAETPIAGTEAQLSQVVAEVLSVVPSAQLSQVVLEVLSLVPSAQLSQVVVEVLRQADVEPTTAALVTQSVLEALLTTDPAIWATQSVLEALTTTDPAIRVTQHVLEVLAFNPGPLGCPEPPESFHDVSLDQYISYGCKCKLKFQTFVVRMRQGHEERIGEWQDPIWTFDLTPALRDQADLDYLIAFFRARNGPEFVFKFFNPLDYQVQNEVFGYGDGVTTVFQLSRRYPTHLPGDGLYYVRPIVLPAPGTVIYADGVSVAGELHTVCTFGGTVIFATPPPPGQVLTWSGMYYTPVRFLTNRVYSVVEHYEHFEDQIMLIEERLPLNDAILPEEESPDSVEVRFPTLYAQRATMGPELDVVTITSDSGGTARTLHFTEAKIRFTVEETEQSQAVIQTLLAFFYNRKGRLYSFRARDITDFELVNQVMQPADGVRTQFQIVKNYVSGAQTEVRTITKPNDDVTIAVDGVLADPQPTVDFSTGTVTFATPPAAGKSLTCSGTFDVPVRFDSDEIIFSIQGFEAFNLEAIGLLEVEPGLPAFTLEAFAT